MAKGKFNCNNCGHVDNEVVLNKDDLGIHSNCTKCGSSNDYDSNGADDITEISEEDKANIGELNKEYNGVNLHEILTKKGITI